MSWYAVHTKSRHEDKVYVRLLQKSITTFLPKLEVWSTRKDRRKRIKIPMFSGYLFVDIPEMTNESKLDVLTTYGVVRILGKPNSHVPVPVPDEQIEAIQRLVDSDIEIQGYRRCGRCNGLQKKPLCGLDRYSAAFSCHKTGRFSD